ncbi:efflux RND transporter periplasmic adaptor subunit [Sulfurovum mangrovi]|uniref:efflux RND transporter periplasmic adaptor subunit n=1 Tax=Sulfurovum mangrovi TaxID=2893889 RepID=UPI001E5AA841|nr:efflux RND transporter periplasmic adaptor subunit [Sulfurovum mangrovi]UFH59571.1 efflux RND transporter periplasmic adaptor subunit [Sulfurovum mangrovi]UFH60711.1 efflux RND transporter periplasmic adaptor subunit [Sulfurovum mangrovi]
MRFLLPFIIFLTLHLHAEVITLTPAEEKNWDIQTRPLQSSPLFPLGEFLGEVTPPPSLIQSISLPFDATVQQLYIAKYQQVKKGELLARVSGSAWIDEQQQAIKAVIALKEQMTITKRKKLLCGEGIIPQKECTAAEAALEVLKIKRDASRALLESYGANDETVEKLFQTLKISKTLDIVSPYNGTVTVHNATPGKNLSSSETLFVIYQEERQWIESKIEARYATLLRKDQPVEITFRGKTFASEVVERASVVEPASQTVLVRFRVPEEVSLQSGLRGDALISIKEPMLKIPKSAVINIGAKKTVFVKKDKGYMPLSIEINAEDEDVYYISDEKQYHQAVAVSSVAILKNLIGDENE